MVGLDHVLIAVTDLAVAARELEARYGLESVEGGLHPGWGTANRIVPLGVTYLELVAVVDEVVAEQSVFGRWVGSGASEVGRLLGWAVRTHDVDEVGHRLGLTVTSGSRMTPLGELIEWRSAGIEQAAAEPSLPFFIEWSRGTRLPGNPAVARGADPVGISKVVLSGDPDRLADWLGDHDLPIVVYAGVAAVAAVTVTRAAGDVVLGVDHP